MPPTSSPELPWGVRCSRQLGTDHRIHSESMLPSAQAPAWLEMPDEIMKSIMQHLGLKERLTVAAPVCKKFMLAAAAATQHVELHWNLHPLQRLPKTHIFRKYIACHGRHLLSLNMESSRDQVDLQWLCCPNLQSLRLVSAKIQLGATDDHPGLLSSCSSLTKLSLEDCTLTDPQPSLAVLAAAPNLQELLLKLKLDSVKSTSTGAQIGAPSSVVQQLTKLQRLAVAAHNIPAREFLQHMGCLRNLQQLNISTSTRASSPTFSAANFPGFSELTNLTIFSIWDSELDVDVLEPFTQLRALRLTAFETVQDGDVLLSCIARMTRLQTLALVDPRLKMPPAPAAYTALTASTNLQLLRLRRCALPAGIWLAIFPAAGSWPQLLEFEMPRDAQITGAPPGGPNLPMSFVTADLDRLVRCCPALQTCMLHVAPFVDCAPLKQLSGLQSLTVSGVRSQRTFTSLTVLTQLGRLSVRFWDELIKPRCLVRFTTLQGLTHLETQAINPTSSRKLNVLLQEGPATGPVWLQLLKHCAGVDDCQNVLLSDLVREVGQQHQQNAQLQKQGAQQQAEITLQQRRADKLQQQLADAAAEAGEAVELRGRVQTLEGQVQQLLQALRDKVT